VNHALKLTEFTCFTTYQDYVSLNFGWAIGVALGVLVSGGISGGHINPAVTLAFATWRNFPWKKVPMYITAQVMGGLVGAAIVYANYFHAIDIFEGGRGVRTLSTAGLFSTYAVRPAFPFNRRLQRMNVHRYPI
jgi:aquaglyceroporin related protein